MNHRIASIALFALSVLFGGCAVAQGGNGFVSGFVYSGYKMGGNVGPGAGAKIGESCASSILGMVAVGDASISAAKAAGGITQIAHVDHDNFDVLGVYATTCTIVVGQ
ncbi:MAG TPA: TRL-like family protein [Polyangiaceae bacterium]